LTGVVLEAKGVMRHDQVVHTEEGPGVVTSGIFSPTLGHSVALARLPRAASGACEVEVRGKRLPARIVRPPFVRKGARVYK
ncbi:MAG: glycine cleavage system protein T, partial [Anaerolineae bacterium]|nr:glycine cleavage system protein T [Anaerolineae bacterium]